MSYDEIFDYFKDNDIYVDCHDREERRAIVRYLNELQPDGDFQCVADSYPTSVWPYLVTSSVSRNWVLSSVPGETVWTVNDFWSFVGANGWVSATQCPDLENVP